MPLPKTWVTRDGREISIREMTDEHLVNTLRMLRRNAPVVRLRYEFALIRRLESLLCGLQGEMAIDCAEREIDMHVDAMVATSDDEWLHEQLIFRALRNEAKRRGINAQSAPRGGWISGTADATEANA